MHTRHGTRFVLTQVLSEEPLAWSAEVQLECSAEEAQSRDPGSGSVLCRRSEPCYVSLGDALQVRSPAPTWRAGPLNPPGWGPAIR